MKIAFFTETGYEGKFPRNNPNMRTDAAWICALNATHHPISVIHNIPSNSYDWGIVIIPKKKDRLVQYPLVEEELTELGYEMYKDWHNEIKSSGMSSDDYVKKIFNVPFFTRVSV